MLIVDAHVHLRDWAQSGKETLLHGMSVGVGCGIGTFFDMPNTNPPLTNADVIRSRIADGNAAAVQVHQAQGILPSYHLYAGVTADMDQVADMVRLHRQLFPSVVALKMFAGHSTGNMGLVEEQTQRAIYQVLVREGYTGVLAVHCEKESCLNPGAWNVAIPSSHSLARPVEAEVQSILDQIRFATEAGFAGTLHVCHISSTRSLQVVTQARAQGYGFSITCGATAHHALLDEGAYGISANMVKMNPPLRTAADRQAIFAGLLDGTIDWVESDHAPHTFEDKLAGASGIPGFAGTLLLLEALRNAGCSSERLQMLFGHAALDAFGLPRDQEIELPSRKLVAHMIESATAAYPFDPFLLLK